MVFGDGLTTPTFAGLLSYNVFPMRACLTGVVYCICRERVVKLFVHRKNLFNGGIRFTFL
jgi:hypothetical protein